MHTNTFFGYESVILEIFGSLDIILVLVSPIKFHFLTLVRNGINALLIATLRDKVALIVVAVEERKESRIDIAFESRDVGALCELPIERDIFQLFRRIVGQCVDSHAELCDFILYRSHTLPDAFFAG